MADGRTTWWGKDGRWWGRERVVVLGQEFGSEGPAVLDWLSCEAQLQRDGGAVKTGYAAVAHGCFADAIRVRDVVRRAAEIGALDDLVEHGLTFTARVSGWAADQATIRAAERQAKKRAQDREGNHDESHDVTVSHAESRITRPDQTKVKDPSSSDLEQISELFAYWQQQCGHPHATLSAERRRKIAGRLREGFTPQQLREAIDGAAAGAVTRGKKRFDDIELICRSASKVDSFIGRESPPVDDSPSIVRPRRETASELLSAIEEAA